MIGRILAAVVREWSDTDKLQGYYVLLGESFFSVQFSFRMYLQTLWLKKKEVFVLLLASVHLCVALDILNFSFLVR